MAQATEEKPALIYEKKVTSNSKNGARSVSMRIDSSLTKEAFETELKKNSLDCGFLITSSSRFLSTKKAIGRFIFFVKNGQQKMANAFVSSTAAQMTNTSTQEKTSQVATGISVLI